MLVTAWCLVPQGLGAYGRSPPAAGVGVGAGRRRWPSALAVGSWIAALGGITLGHGYASVVALAFALVGAYAGAFAGAFAGRRLNWEANNAE